ncbi:MAG: hypothetical protein ACE5FA_10140 [Dehalococcoidia bacterium]
MLERLRDDQRRFWEKAVSNGKKDRDMVNNVHDVELPDWPKSVLVGEPYIFRHGDAGDISESFQGLIGVRPQYGVDEPGLGPRPKRDAEDVEKFANTVRWVIEDELGEKVNALVPADLADFGWSGVKVLPYPQRWRKRYPKRNVSDSGDEFEEGDEEYLERVRRFGATAPVPIGIWHIPAAEFWPVLHGDKVVKSLQVYTCKLSYLQATYPRIFPPDESIDKKFEQMDYEIVEYIDDTWQAVWVFNAPDGQKFEREVHVWRHKMPVPEGQAPVVLYRTFNSSDRRPEFRFRGVIRNIYDTLKGKDLVLSRQLTMVQIFMWLTVIFKREKGAAIQNDTVDFNFGDANTLPEGVEMNILGPNQKLPDAEGAYEKLEARRRQHWPDIFLGASIGGESSGYLYQLTRDTALTKIKPAQLNEADSDVEVMRMVFYALGGLTQILRPRSNDITVYVRYTDKKGTEPIKVSWDKVANLINLVKADRSSDLPQDQHSKLDAVAKARAEGMSRSRAWQEIWGLADPEQMDDERIAEDIQDSDVITARRIQDVLVEMDLDFEKQEGETPDETALATADGPFPPAFAAAFGVPPGASELVAAGSPNTGSKRALTSARAGTKTAPDTEPRPPGPGGISGAQG